MKLTIVGRTNPIKRVVTGLYSFDHAFENKAGKIGLPIRAILELSGTTGCGKTTIALALAGMISKSENTNIAFADLEGYDPEMMVAVLDYAGFNNSVFLINETTDEKALDESIQTVFKNKCSIGIFDSVGAISPIAEMQGSLGEANMGRRAKLLSQFSRKVIHYNDTIPDAMFIMTNHQAPVMGGKGMTTPGGETMKFIAPVRIRVKRAEDMPDGSYALEGKVIKNRYGFEDRIFHIFVIVGLGISPDMSAVYDCKKRKMLAGDWRGVKMDGVNFGSYNTIIQKAIDGDKEFFVPFYKALEGKPNELAEVSTDDQDSDDRTSNDLEEV